MHPAAETAAAITTRPSSVSSSNSIATAPGNWKVLSSPNSQTEIGSDSTAPQNASNAPSIRMPRASLERVAPSARHIANSSRRASVRSISRRPTVVHPATRISPTVAASSRENRPTPPRAATGSASMFNGLAASLPRRRVSDGTGRASRRDVASGLVVPSRSRATMVRLELGEL
jgi:hypothetical protein